MTPDTTTPDGQNRPAVDHVSAPNGQAIGINYGQIWQQRFSGPFRLLRHATIPLDPLPGDLRLTDPADPDNPVARFRGRADLINTIDAYLQRCVQQRRGGYLLIEAEAGMGKSALATYLAYTRSWPAHFTRLTEGRNPETARLNLAAQLIARWKLDAAPGGALPDDASTSRWLYGRLCDAAKTRDSDTAQMNQPVVLLVDGLDEAPPPPPGELPLGLPTALPPGTIIVATTRPKTLTIPTGTRIIERIDVESASNRQDLLGYLTTLSTTDPLIVDALHHARMSANQFCQTLLDRSGGIWIYALTVLDQIRDHNRNPTDVDQLPEGLAGYYADNIHRWQHELGDTAWQEHGLPVLATLTAIREPQDAPTIATWAGITKHDTRALLRGIFRPFLAIRRGNTPRDDLYLPRHQSLRDFTAGTSIADSDDYTLRDLADDFITATRAAHHRITVALIPPDPLKQDTWQNTSDYTQVHLPEHAAHAGTLDQLVNNPGFLLTCQPASILSHRRYLTTPAGRAAMDAYSLFLGDNHRDFDGRRDPEGQRFWSLHIGARKARATTLADVAGQRAKRPWTIQTAIWNGTAHHTLSGHTSRVNALAVLPGPDGTTLLASASDDGTVWLWDPITGQPHGKPLTGHTSRVNALAALPGPDGTTLLATASSDHTVRLWNPTTGGTPIGEPLTDHTGHVNALAVLRGPDGATLLATAVGTGGMVRLWNPTTGKPHGQPLTGHTDHVTALAALPGPDGTTLLATASNDRTVRLWNPATGHQVGKPLTGHTRRVNALAALPGPDGTTLLATASNDRTVRLWDPTTGKPHGQPLTGHTGQVTALAALPGPDGATLLAAAALPTTNGVGATVGGTVWLWDPITGQPHGKPLIGHTAQVTALAALPGPDGTTLLATASDDRTVRLWNPTTDQPFTGHTGQVTALAALPGPDGTTLLATASDDRTVRLWNPTTGQPHGQPLTGHTDHVTALAALPGPDGTTLLATASSDGTVRLWNPTTGQPHGQPLTGHTSRVNALAALPGPDGTTLLATASNDRTVRLWNPTTGQPHGQPLTGHTSSVYAIAVLPGPDGTTLLATGSNDGTVRLWNPTARYRRRRHRLTLTGAVNAIAVLPGPDGTTLLATGSNDGTVRLWNPTARYRRRRHRLTLTGHTGRVIAVAVLPSPDGALLLATASSRGKVRLWDPTTGQPHGHPLTGHTIEVTALTALPGPDGTTLLATGNADGAIFLWTPANN